MARNEQGYYLAQVTRGNLRSSLNCAKFLACKPLLSGRTCDVRIESFRTHPEWGSGDNLVALSDVEQVLVGLPARRGRTRSAAAQQCCCSSTARDRRFRGPAASTRIRSIAQEAREPPNRRSTSSSTLDGHLVAAASSAGGSVARVLEREGVAPVPCDCCTLHTPLCAGIATLFAAPGVGGHERYIKIVRSHELVGGESRALPYLLEPCMHGPAVPSRTFLSSSSGR